MAKKLRQRINESFTDGSREDIVQYIEWLRPTLSDLCQGLRRTVTIALLLMAAFELVVESPKTQITIGSFKVSNGSLVIVFIPALVSYLYLQICNDSNRISALRGAFTVAFSRWSATAKRNKLDELISPAQPLYWSVGGRYSTGSWPDMVEAWTTNILIVIVLIGGIAFEVQAYYKLYRNPITHNIPWIISVCVSVLCYVVTATQFIARFPEDY